jgi:hypothetical protein
MVKVKTPKERTEGWGNLDNARDAHYFREGRSLCGYWLAWGPTRWESNQELGEAPVKGTCKKCWKKRATEEKATANSQGNDGKDAR